MGRKKISKEEFINRAANPNYNFSNIEFIDIHTKVEIICKEHGLFSILPANMLYKGEGCKFCGAENMSKSKALTKQEFIKRAKKIHEDKYEYFLVDYKNNKTKVKIICKKCGNVFLQTPNNHLKGCGCPNCITANQEDHVSQDS